MKHVLADWKFSELGGPKKIASPGKSARINFLPTRSQPTFPSPNTQTQQSHPAQFPPRINLLPALCFCFAKDRTPYSRSNEPGWRRLHHFPLISSATSDPGAVTIRRLLPAGNVASWQYSCTLLSHVKLEANTARVAEFQIHKGRHQRSRTSSLHGNLENRHRLRHQGARQVFDFIPSRGD